MNLKILNTRKIKKIIGMLEEQFGFSGKLEYAFLMNENYRVYIVNTDLSSIDLDKIRVNSIGMYFGTQETDGLRLSIEGSQMIGNDCSKNVVELDTKQMQTWMKGEKVDYSGGEKGYVIIKHGNDFLGCGKISKERILNYVSKTRRVNLSG